MSEARKITDHTEIRQWAEKRGGVPSIVKGTESEEGEGVLRFDFGKREPNLKPVDWDGFFEVFEDRDLALLAQDSAEDGESRFFKFVRR